MRLDTTTNTPPGAAPTPNTPHSTAGPDAPPAAHDASPVSPGDQVGNFVWLIYVIGQCFGKQNQKSFTLFS